MSNVFSMFRHKGKGIPSNAKFRITQEGIEKLQEFNGDPQSQVLMMLNTRGTSDIMELSQATGLSRGKLEHIIPKLSPVYVQFVGAGMGDSEG